MKLKFGNMYKISFENIFVCNQETRNQQPRNPFFIFTSRGNHTQSKTFFIFTNRGYGATNTGHGSTNTDAGVEIGMKRGIQKFEKKSD